MSKTPNAGSLNPLTPVPTPTYCPFGASPFGVACGRLRRHTEPLGAQDAKCPAELQDDSIGDLVRLLSRSRPSYRRNDLCLWSK
ncbi:MAG: hypothetical protein HY900_27255 [Deltaproteobacteria bacterium]|nr:hypothetical protein [Deltaproteobacteria bacterium]